MELPILGYTAGNGIPNNTVVSGLYNTDNLDNNPYLSNKPYQNLTDDDDNNDDDDDNNIKIVAKPAPYDASK